MRLAADDITVTVGGEIVTLRPTLRAAWRLHEQHGGFGPLARKIVEGNLTVTAEVIGQHVSLPFLEAKVWDAGLDNLRGPLLRYVLQCAGGEQGGEEDATEGELVPFAEYFSRLYRIATGWLGWPPETAWSATPAEIIEAHRGRVEMLKAIFGGSEGSPTPKSKVPLEEKLRMAFSGIGTVKVHRTANA